MALHPSMECPVRDQHFFDGQIDRVGSPFDSAFLAFVGKRRSIDATRYETTAREYPFP